MSNWGGDLLLFSTISNKSVEIVFENIFFLLDETQLISIFYEDICFFRKKSLFHNKNLFSRRKSSASSFYRMSLLFTKKNYFFPYKKTFFQLFQCIFPLSTEVNSENSPKESTKQIYTQELKVLWDERMRQNYK